VRRGDKARESTARRARYAGRRRWLQSARSRKCNETGAAVQRAVEQSLFNRFKAFPRFSRKV
jgi:hypothetical protein